MSKLRDIIRDVDDLSKQSWTVEEWVDPDTGEPVVLELRSPTVRRRSELLKQFRDDNGMVDLGEMQLGLVREMSFDPVPDEGQENEPLFAVDDLEWLADKSGTAVWKIAQECMFIAGLQEREDTLGEGAENDLVDAGKAS